jgi:lipoprotein-anchoring transpeptidase ErfK/SrfK
LQFPTPRTIHLAILLAAFCAGTARAASVPGSSGATPGDPRHEIIVSVKEQKLLLLTDGKPEASYPVSTSKFGIGDRLGSYATPLGKFFVRMKIGMGQPLGAVFRSRRPTGEVLKPNAPGRDPIVTRILWLEGTEAGNRNAFGRGIYIHGTPQESALGRPASYGCIRMRSKDVATLCDRVSTGATVRIITEHLPERTGWGGFLNANRLVAANTRVPESSGEKEAE